MGETGDLSIVLRDGRRHALLLDARVQGEDVYAGRKLVWGKRFPRYGQRANGEPLDVEGKLRLSAMGSDLESLDWKHRPRRNGKRRITEIVELPQVECFPSFTSELWAFEPGRADLVDEHLREHYEPAGRVVAAVLAPWTRPNLLGLLWTLKSPAWAGLHQ